MGSLARVCSGSTQSPKKLRDRDMSSCRRLDWYLAYDVRNRSTTFTESCLFADALYILALPRSYHCAHFLVEEPEA